MSSLAQVPVGVRQAQSGDRSRLGVVDEHSGGLSVHAYHGRGGKGIAQSSSVADMSMRERLRERRSVAVFGRRKTSGLNIGKVKSGALTDYEVSESEAEGALSIRSGITVDGRRFGLEMSTDAEGEGEEKKVRRVPSARKFFTKFS